MNAKMIAAGLGLSIFFGLTASAQQPSPPPAVATPAPAAEHDDDGPAPRGNNRGRGALAACRGDIATHCAGVERGRKNRIVCLTQHEAKLSSGCSAAIQPLLEDRTRRGSEDKAARAEGGRGSRGSGRLAACQGDIASLCSGTEPGHGGRIRCLRDSQAKLSPDCAQSLAAVRDGRKQLRQACAAERETICAKSGGGGNNGGLVACLRQHAMSLSEACGSALEGMPGGKGRRRGDRADAGGARQDPTTPPASLSSQLAPPPSKPR